MRRHDPEIVAVLVPLLVEGVVVLVAIAAAVVWAAILTGAA
jgi:hypothetical protein